MPLVDDYLEFLAGEVLTENVLAAGYDVKVSFGVSAKPSEEVHSDEVIDRVTCSKIGGPLEVGLRGVTGAAQSEA